MRFRPKVLLTGATGFIGSHVLQKLVVEGCEVHALIRPGSNMWRIDSLRRCFKVVPCDLFAGEELDRGLARVRPELCIHLAWYVEFGKFLDSLENVRLLSASLGLAIRLAHLGCRRFVAAGTCLEYDFAAGPVSERSPVAPRSLYATAKSALRAAVEQLGPSIGMEFAWLRFFHMYGPHEDRRRLVPSLTCALLRNQEARVANGELMRDFLHVEDVAAATWAVAQSNLCGAVNVGSGRPVAVRDVAAAIGGILNRGGCIKLSVTPLRSHEPMFLCADNTRLRLETGWAPAYDLQEGLRNAIQWWQAHLDG